MFDRDFLERVSSLVDIVDIIGEHVQLKKSGANHKGLCPFHQEKTPSFMVNRAKGIFRCFGCGKGGDVFRFLMEHDGLSFSESVRHLAQRAGVPVPREGRTPEANELREQIFEANRLAAKFYRDALNDAPAESVRRYLQNRQINGQMITEFDIGYAPDGWRRLSDTLKRAGIPVPVLAAAGLVITTEDGFYDRFRDRLMIPIRDTYHRICGFGGRILGPGEPKYLNSPETEVFKKSRLLFGLHRARDAIRQSRTAVIVEGYFDVIMMHQVGVTNVVAPLGTALTSEHVALVHRSADDLVLLFDGDAAGRRAAGRSIELLFENGRYNARVGLLPQGKDPDDAAREGGEAAVRKIIGGAVSAIDFLIGQAMDKADTKTPEGKLNVIKDIMPILAQLPDELTRATLAAHVAARVGVKEDLAIRAAKKSRPAGKTAAPELVSPLAKPLALSRGLVEDQFIWVLLNTPELAADAFERVTPDDFQTPALREIARALQSTMFSGQEFTVAHIRLRLPTDEIQAELDRLNFPVWGGWDIEFVHRESMIQGCVGRLHQWRHHLEQAALQRQVVERTAGQDVDDLLRAKRESKLAQLSYVKMIASIQPPPPPPAIPFEVPPEQDGDAGGEE